MYLGRMSLTLWEKEANTPSQGVLHQDWTSLEKGVVADGGGMLIAFPPNTCITLSIKDF